MQTATRFIHSLTHHGDRFVIATTTDEKTNRHEIWLQMPVHIDSTPIREAGVQMENDEDGGGVLITDCATRHELIKNYVHYANQVELHGGDLKAWSYDVKEVYEENTPKSFDIGRCVISTRIDIASTPRRFTTWYISGQTGEHTVLRDTYNEQSARAAHEYCCGVVARQICQQNEKPIMNEQEDDYVSVLMSDSLYESVHEQYEWRAQPVPHIPMPVFPVEPETISGETPDFLGFFSDN